MNNKSINFLMLIALFIGFSYGARADFKWDTLWVKFYTQTTNKLVPIAGEEKTLGAVGNFGDPLFSLAEFSELTGDSLRTLCNFNTYFEPLFRYKDSNLVLGNASDYNYDNYAAFLNIQTGVQKPIRKYTDRLVHYYPVDNNAIICNYDGTLVKYNLDSNKVLMYPIFQPGWFEEGKYCGNYVSPKGTYLARFGHGPRNGEPDKTVYRDYILNANDFSYKKILTDSIIDNYNDKDDIGYMTGVFNDQETLFALAFRNRKGIAFFDLTLNKIIKQIDFDQPISFLPFYFDSTGKYLIVWKEFDDINDRVIFINTETYQIDYMTEDFPEFGDDRIPFTNILYRNPWARYSITELVLSVYNELSHKCNINYSSQVLNINSETQQQISSIYIYDSNARTVYQNCNSALTPISANIELSSGVYFIILKIEGKNEYHKILVQ